jgi:phospholipid/cholesterol/gamma-HCH transport system permease protein
VVTQNHGYHFNASYTCLFGDAIALFGSYLVENIKGHVSFLLYFNQVFNALDFGDLIPATIKVSFLALP